jgi:hypothetical protein
MGEVKNAELKKYALNQRQGLRVASVEPASSPDHVGRNGKRV